MSLNPEFIFKTTINFNFHRDSEIQTFVYSKDSSVLLKK